MTFLDFFSGIGGFRLGMEQAGHKCLGHCEIDKFANISYKAMHNPKEDEWFGTDIRRVRADELPTADVWCFGFPCQDISVAGKQAGFKGNRSSLFFAVTRIIRDTDEESRPSILFIENVKNLLSVNSGYDFAKLLIELDEIGYDAEWQVLNTKDFGIPQNRERVFIIGHLRGRSAREVFPIRTSCQATIEQQSGISQQIASTLCAGDHKISRGMTLIDVRPVLTPDRAEKRQNGRRFKENGEPMFTLTAQDRHGISANGRIRRLTPKESFRLQGWPDEYFNRAKGVCSDSQLYKQAGNGVTVNVIYHISKRF